VAIKIIEKSKLTDNDKVRLQREKDINRLIDHESILTFNELYEDNEGFYFVMDLMTGGELYDRIAKGGPMPELECKRHMRDLFDAVTYLHKNGVAHRDLKPENLLFTSHEPNAKIKIIDFGFAKIEVNPHELQTPVGTPAFVAPEVMTQETYSKSVDMWSLGCVLFFMLFGKPPFYSPDQKELEEMVSNGEFEIPSTPEVSQEAISLIYELLELDSEKRITAINALEHKWFTKDLSNNNKSTNNNLWISTDNLKQVKHAFNIAYDISTREKELNNQNNNNKNMIIVLGDPMESPLWIKKPN